MSAMTSGSMTEGSRFDSLSSQQDHLSHMPPVLRIPERRRDHLLDHYSTSTLPLRIIPRSEPFGDYQQRPSTSPATYTPTSSSFNLDTSYNNINNNQNNTFQPPARTRSPYTRATGSSAARSRSTGQGSHSPIETRARSLPPRSGSPSLPSPSYNSLGFASPTMPFHRPQSPFGRSNIHNNNNHNNYPSSIPSPPSFEHPFETISEDAALEVSRPFSSSSATSYRSNSNCPSPPPPPVSASGLFRSASPRTLFSSSNMTSPSLSTGGKFMNENYPQLHSYSSNNSFFTSSSSSVSTNSLSMSGSNGGLFSYCSMPSTPSTARSRSPSISSLDTIEDVPDLEKEALEADRDRLAKVHLGDMDGNGDVVRRGGSLDIQHGNRPVIGFGFGSKGGNGNAAAARKRWSVCGAERRADLDLETIWED